MTKTHYFLATPELSAAPLEISRIFRTFYPVLVAIDHPDHYTVLPYSSSHKYTKITRDEWLKNEGGFERRNIKVEQD